MKNYLVLLAFLIFIGIILYLERKISKEPVLEKKSFDNIQILRGFAAIQVVIYHIYHYFWIVAQKHTVFDFHEKIFPVGFGAWFFFVISGFIMAYLISSNYDKFLLRRLLRIFPIYIITVILILFIKVVIFGTVSSKNLLLALTLFPYIDKQIDYPLFVEWTLIYEIFFYLVCSIFAIGKLKKYFLMFSFLWLIIISIRQIMSGTIVPLVPNIYNIFFSGYNILFIGGIFSFYIYNKFHLQIRKVFRWKSIALCFSILCAIAMFFSISKISIIDNKNISLVIFTLLSIAIIVVMSVFDISSAPNRIRRLLIKIGDSSYGMYLIHANFLAISIRCMDLQGINFTPVVCFSLMFLTLVAGYGYGQFEFVIHKQISSYIISVARKFRRKIKNA